MARVFPWTFCSLSLWYFYLDGVTFWYILRRCSNRGAPVSLRKSPTLTPALLASNRRNAQKSTGPRTARGKAWSRLNRMRSGIRSREYLSFVDALMGAPPGQVGPTAADMLSSKLAIHPLYFEAVDSAVKTEMQLCNENARWKTHRSETKTPHKTFEAGMSLKTNVPGGDDEVVNLPDLARELGMGEEYSRWLAKDIKENPWEKAKYYDRWVAKHHSGNKDGQAVGKAVRARPPEETPRNIPSRNVIDKKQTS
jgi:hypothetical protein